MGNHYDALALLYLSKLDLSEMSPEDLADKYREVADKIKVQLGKQRSDRTSKDW